MIASQPVLCVTDLHFGWPSRTLATKLFFELNAGELCLLSGGNGTGKSTLLRTLFGLQQSLMGSVAILGHDVANTPQASLIRAGARFLGQGRRAFSFLTVQENRQVLRRLYGIQPALPPTPDARRIGRLSVGQQRLEALALLRAGEPKILLLDEPLAGLDAHFLDETCALMRGLLASGCALVVAEQRLAPLQRFATLSLVLRSNDDEGPANSGGWTVSRSDVH